MEDCYTNEVKTKKGQLFCFDITQDWNPFPVIIVCGYLLSNNKKRISMGVACRDSYGKAIEKAYLEWIQGCTFAGYYDEFHKDLSIDKVGEVNSFDLHAVYYTKHPEKWEKTPLIKHRKHYSYDNGKILTNSGLVDMDIGNKLSFLLEKLRKAEIRLFYRNLTTCDVKDAGITVMRVISPVLSFIHSDENTPFLGGRTKDVKWRYNGLKGGKYPNSFPHPLG